MPEPAYVPDTNYAHEPNYKHLSLKQTVQYTVTLLAHWMHGHTEREIAELVGIAEQDVRRDLERTLGLIDRRRAHWRGEKSAPKTAAVDQMPAAICSQCESAIPRGAYRVTLLAASRDRRDEDDRDIVAMTRTLIFCGDCAMSMPEFTIVNDFKRRAERRAEWLTAPGNPEEDALSNGRATTGHSGTDGHGAHDPHLEYNPRALPEGVAPTELRSTKEVARQRLACFLKDPCSRGKFSRPVFRIVAELYAKNLTQCEIAKRTGMDQSSVSRAIQAVLKLACAA